MSRLVFSVLANESADGPGLGIAIREPGRVNRMTVPLTFGTGAPQFAALHGVPEPNAVREAGRLLFDALMAHDEVGPELTAAMHVRPPERRPVLVDLNATIAERFPWEALCTAQGEFLGLDERWAVGRIVDQLNPARGLLLFEPPLRVAAVLSCLDVPAEAEWAALRAAREATDLPVEILVLTSEEGLFTSIDREIKDGLVNGVTVEYVPAKVVPGLADRLRAFDAHVLHLFCHGSSKDTSPHLQIALKSDWLRPDRKSSLLVEARDFGEFTHIVEGRPWLVVLNSCETGSTGGAPSQQSVSLSLVHEHGVHAAIGMREPVLADDAHLFTGAFYGQLFPELHRILGAAAFSAEVEWPRLVAAARQQLAKDKEPLSAERGTRKEWTLPVVYTRAAPFELHVPPTSAGEQQQQRQQQPASEEDTVRSIVISIDVLTSLRALLEDSGDEVLLADIDRELSELADRLRGR